MTIAGASEILFCEYNMRMPRPKVLDRPYRLNMHLSEEERDLVFRLAARERITVSDYVRALIFREATKDLGWSRDAKKGKKK
jgi:hypothetical protein